jgi:site-specific DNA recombinase
MKKKTASKNNLEGLLEQLTVKQYSVTAIKRGNDGVIYTRVSSQEQKENNGSLDVQRKYCEEFSKRMQIPIREYFGGSYESAKSDGRKEFQRMLTYVRKHKNISYLIVLNYDRFSRTGAAAAQLSEELRKEGIIVKSVMQDIDTSTASGRLQENFFHLLNNFDNRSKSDRTKINTKEVMLKGYWPYHTPMGYKNLNEKRRACFHNYIITDEGKELKKAFVLKAEGKLSNKEIIDKLNLRGVSLTEKNFRWVISNPFYAGYVTGKLLEGKLVKGQHPALIELETFLKANAILQQAPTAGIPKQHRHEELPLKIFAKDELSGQPLTGYITKGNWYYKTKKGTFPVNISATKLNSLFITILNQFEYKKEYKNILAKLLSEKLKIRLTQSVAESKLLKKKLSEKQTAIDKIEEKFVLGQINAELFEKYSTKYKQELNELQQELDHSTIDSSNLDKGIEKCLQIAQNIGAAWVEASFENKQRLQNLVFPEGILYNKLKGVVRTPRVNSLFAAIEPLKRITAENKKGNSVRNRLKSDKVPRTGFEPAHPFERCHLKAVRLPISPSGLDGLQI